MMDQAQSAFFSMLPGEVRNKIYEQFAFDVFHSPEGSFQQGFALANTCRRTKEEMGAILAKHVVRIYYPQKKNAFKLTGIQHGSTELGKVLAMTVHLIWEDTLLMRFFSLWRQSFFALSRELSKLPQQIDSVLGMPNLQYVQIQLHPAPEPEVCQGAVSGLDELLNHPALKAVDVYGTWQDCKDYNAPHEYLQELQKRRHRERMINLFGCTDSDFSLPDTKTKTLIVEITRFSSTAALDADMRAQTETTKEPEFPWYFKTTDTNGRFWGSCFVQVRATHMNQVEALHTLESEVDVYWPTDFEFLSIN